MNYFAKPLIATLLLFVLSMSATMAQSMTDQIDELLSLYQEYGDFNGSALVSVNGKPIYKGGKGMANMEWQIANDADTKHRLGSITKQFTATLIMQLVEDGKLKLDVPITTYLPDYPAENGDRITLHHLMTHTAGIPNYTNDRELMMKEMRNSFTPAEFVDLFDELELEFEPGSSFSYSNSGYFLLGYILEEVTGESYETLLQKNIFDPLKMNDSGYDHHETILRNRAAGYEKQGGNYITAPYIDMSLPYAAGSMYSTALDMLKWDQALYGEKVLSKKSLEIMFTQHTLEQGENNTYGYGYDMATMDIGSTDKTVNTIGHGGGIPGFSTLFTRIPDKNAAIILLNNTGGVPLREISESIVGILSKQAYDLPKPSMATALLDLMYTADDMSAAKKFYQEAKKSDTYDLDEGDMNMAGYNLMGQGKLKEAAAIFKINMNAFPESFNVYDSYAESQMELGNKEEAINYYKKSIEIFPGNENGVDMLKKLGAEVDEMTKSIEIAEEILDTYVGDYEIMPGFILSISRKGNQLITQATGQPAVEIYPKSETRFYLKVVQAELEFQFNGNGAVTGVTLYQGGQEMEGKRL